jgi:AraC family transcriptional regulator
MPERHNFDSGLAPFMDVRIIDFPETRVAALEHRGPPDREHETVSRFVAWRIANRLSPERHRSYGLHYNDPRTTPGVQYRMDVCVSVAEPVAANRDGVINKVIPAGRCAVARYLGSRDDVRAAHYLREIWLPGSGETLRDYPTIFHYVNVGPGIAERDMITDVYLPIR